MLKEVVTNVRPQVLPYESIARVHIQRARQQDRGAVRAEEAQFPELT